MSRCCLALVSLALVACRPLERGGIAEAQADAPHGSTDAPDSNRVAVVELFTSEGCSSCPPADTVLTDLAATQRSVYALSFHVDYWDDLGWPDRFASPDYTARQRSYARSFGSRGLFTPQMVVNGVESFTGSDRTLAVQSVARALARPVEVRLSIRVRPAASHGIIVDYDAPDAPAGALIDVAVVEHTASTQVQAGENAGRSLSHTNVVRSYVVAMAKREDSVRVRVAPALQDGEVIAYIQRSFGAAGLPVLGAARAPLPR